MGEALQPSRNQLHHGTKQLKSVAATGMPLVVAVANSILRPAPFSAEMMLAAMYGDPRHGLTLDRGFQVAVGRNGKLTYDHPYLNAVMLVRKGAEARAAVDRWREMSYHVFGSAQDMARNFGAFLSNAPLGAHRASQRDKAEPVSVEVDMGSGQFSGTSC